MPNATEVSRRSGNALTQFSISRKEAGKIVELAKNNGVFYLSCRYDAMWKTLRAWGTQDVQKALLRVDAEITFPQKSLELRQCKKANPRFSSDRQLECDSCYSIPAGKITVGNEPQRGDTVLKNRVITHINRYGAIFIAEMQKDSRQEDSGDGKNTKVDTIYQRAEHYSAGAIFIDQGHAKKGKNSSDIREGKNSEHEGSRSVVVTAYRGYGQFGDVRGNPDSCSLISEFSNQNCPVRGTLITTFDLGSFIKREKYSEEEVRKMIGNWREKELSAYSQATQDILIILAIGHLLTPIIVNGFCDIARKICKILEVNVDNIVRNQSSDEEIMALIKRFKETEEANARADEAVRERDAEKARADKAVNKNKKILEMVNSGKLQLTPKSKAALREALIDTPQKEPENKVRAKSPLLERNARHTNRPRKKGN